MLSESDISALYQSHSQKMLQFLVANGMDYAMSCDFVQNAFIKLWQKREDIKDESSASGFLFTVIKNLKVDYHRKNNRMYFRDDLEDDAAGTTAHPEQDSSDIDRLRSALQQAFAQLPDNLRETYTLFQVSQYSIKEIAKATGASESLVKVRIHRAKDKLKEILADFEDLESYLS